MFPIVYATDVARSAKFYSDCFGFKEHYRHPPEGEAGYVSLRLNDIALGIATIDSPKALIGARMGDAPRFELFVYVDDVDAEIEHLRRAGIEILMPPADMPWGERMAYIADPDGNPIVLANE